MTLMLERSCAIVVVDDATYLCLPEGADIPLLSPAGGNAPTLGEPRRYDHTIRVFAGSDRDDFRWTRVVPGHAPTTPSCAGIAAAVTALIFGLALQSERLLGSEICLGTPGAYFPPRESWWGGEWRSEIQEALERHWATLQMHGVLVLG